VSCSLTTPAFFVPYTLGVSPLRGTVTKIVGSSSHVEAQDAGSYRCDLRGRLFRRKGVRLAVGDEVEFTVDVEPTEDDDGVGTPGHGVIEELLPRRTFLRRTRDFKRDQVLCANVDKVFVVTAIFDPPYKRAFIDRVLVGVERDGLEAIVVFNKMDLADEDYAEVVTDDANVYRKLGYTTLLVSAENGEGVEALRAAFAGQISVVVGPSGVGKSTLLNTVCPGVKLRTGEVSAQRDRRGKHTTTSAELIPVPGGGFVVDTPGLRAFGLWDVGVEAINSGFREIEAVAPRCRFGDCAHKSEPDCAVRAAAETGEIDEERLLSYTRLREDALAQDQERKAKRRR
jgi:ribosome biogenesis GTPase / thiamine phosphate phosphatase